MKVSNCLGSISIVYSLVYFKILEFNNEKLKSNSK